jgi:DNA-binding response OmpR family regulator
MAKVLLVEDDLELAGMIQAYLQHEHHNVEMLHDGEDASAMLKIYPFDLIILDWMLPGRTGIEVCQKYRASGGTAPILMLTGKESATDKVTGLDAGADDYLTKPFNIKELAARLRALLRRSTQATSAVLEAGHISLDPQQHRAWLSGQEIRLLPKEFALLEFLLRNPQRIYSADALLKHVWESESEASTEAVRTAMKRLRKKIETPDGHPNLKTVHGVGYVLEP